MKVSSTEVSENRDVMEPETTGRLWDRNVENLSISTPVDEEEPMRDS